MWCWPRNKTMQVWSSFAFFKTPKKSNQNVHGQSRLGQQLWGLTDYTSGWFISRRVCCCVGVDGLTMNSIKKRWVETKWAKRIIVNLRWEACAENVHLHHLPHESHEVTLVPSLLRYWRCLRCEGNRHSMFRRKLCPTEVLRCRCKEHAHYIGVGFCKEVTGFSSTSGFFSASPRAT